MEYRDKQDPGGSYSSYHNMKPILGEGHNEFTRLCNVISNNIQKISQNVSSMLRMVNQLGTPQDSEKLRDQLHQLQHYSKQLVKDTDQYLKALKSVPAPHSASEQRNCKLQNERLRNEFSIALNSFQTVQRQVAEQEKASFKRARAHSGLGGVSILPSQKSPFGDDDVKNGETFLIDHGQRMSLQMEEDVDINTLKEREQSIRKLESDIVDINQIFKDLAVMVHEQGDTIDSIESNVESAQIHVKQGGQQLSKAKDYQTKARKKMCICIAVLVIVLAIIGLALGLTYGTNKS